jgi:hypothetical protein
VSANLELVRSICAGWARDGVKTAPSLLLFDGFAEGIVERGAFAAQAEAPAWPRAPE